MTDWSKQAACRDADPRAFFPRKGDNGLAAKAICATCPVQGECLETALEWEETEGVVPHGVFGGLSGIQREKLIRRRRATHLVAV